MRTGLLISALLLTGCQKVTMHTGLAQGSQTYNTSAWFVLNGLFGHKEVNLDEHCPNGVSKMQSEVGITGLAISMLTLGMVTKVDITLQCAPGTK